MHKTVLTFTLAAILTSPFVTPLVAQGTDADKPVAGGGEVAPGWEMRIDPDAGSATAPRFAVMGSGFHVTSGSRAIYWRPADVAKGNYTVTAIFTLMTAADHPEAYGLFFGGNDLKTPKENYMYFTLGGTGSYLIKHRANDETIHTIVNWTPNKAISAPDASGKRTDTLTVMVGAQKVQYLINGKEVYSMDRAQAHSPEGIVGIRVSHNIDVHIDKFAVTPMKK